MHILIKEASVDSVIMGHFQEMTSVTTSRKEVCMGNQIPYFLSSIKIVRLSNDLSNMLNRYQL